MKRIKRINRRTMTTIIKTLSDCTYQDAMRELEAIGNPKATIQRFGTGWRLGLMGFAVSYPQAETVPVHKPTGNNTKGSLWDFL